MKILYTLFIAVAFSQFDKLYPCAIYHEGSIGRQGPDLLISYNLLSEDSKKSITAWQAAWDTFGGKEEVNVSIVLFSSVQTLNTKYLFSGIMALNQIAKQNDSYNEFFKIFDAIWKDQKDLVADTKDVKSMVIQYLFQKQGKTNGDKPLTVEQIGTLISQNLDKVQIMNAAQVELSQMEETSYYWNNVIIDNAETFTTQQWSNWLKDIYSEKEQAEVQENFFLNFIKSILNVKDKIHQEI